MEQTWQDLLFLHWPMPTEQLRPLVPPQLELDLFNGQAWVAVVPFRMRGIHLRGLPPLPGTSETPELNVRTYVKYRGRPGVYFFSLDAASIAGVWVGRGIYHLPYFHARMKCERQGEEVRYSSERLGKLAKGKSSAVFGGRYAPIARVELRKPGSIGHWLTERYCLYTVSGDQVYAGEIHHEPWPLQNAEATIDVNSMAASAGITLPGTPPLLHFARELRVLIWSLRRV